jgi:Na+/H+ antiporter NhaA
MGGQNIFDLISKGISELLNSKLGFLEASGLNLFRGLAIIMIAWYGIKAAISSAQGGEGFSFAKFADMLLLIAFGFAMLMPLCAIASRSSSGSMMSARPKP